MKMGAVRKFRFSHIHIIITLPFLVCLFTTVSTKTSNIVFEDNVYKNVLLAINGNIPANGASCIQLIENLKKLLQNFSTKLSVATNGRASLGSVDIVIPNEWTSEFMRINCSNPPIERSKVFQNYDNADIKITANHPIAKSLPWTKQYRGCGQEAESIYIPPLFLNNPYFNEDIKGNFLLHEWAKFRYGVFEEYGYFDDNYSPCYMKSGKFYFTSCTEIPLTNEDLNKECKLWINEQNDAIKSELSKNTASVMASPHLWNVASFCTPSYHNRFAPTKQNFMCDRRSASDVIFSHTDFQMAGKAIKSFHGKIDIQFRFIHGEVLAASPSQQGYAFLIEDSDEIRKNGRLKIVKQAVTQMVNRMESTTEVMLMRFNGGAFDKIPLIKGISTETLKMEFLNVLPDQESSPMTLSDRRFMTKDILIGSMLEIIIPILKQNTSKYKMILLGSEAPIGTDNATAYFAKESDVSFSIVTFDSSSEWLKWNTIPNTDKMLYMPPCMEQRCNGKLLSLLTDNLLEILGNSQPRRYFNKIAEVPINGTTNLVAFTVEENISHFMAVLSMYGHVNNTVVIPPTVLSPSNNQSCKMKKMLNYNNLHYFDTEDEECYFEAGEWKLSFLSGSLFNFLQVYSESSTSVVITTALGRPLEHTLSPSQGAVPVYASVSSSFEEPIINATVTLDVFISDNKSFQLPLLDDGLYPDAIKDDGVYSANLKEYSPTPATHLGQIIVQTTSDTRKIIHLSDVGNAALLDTQMSTKCCGDHVPILQNGGLTSVIDSRHSAFISSFKTNEDFIASDIPPSKIKSIDITEGAGRTGTAVVLQFLSPGGVKRYDICCFVSSEDISCSEIPHGGNDCLPVEAGMNQRCSVQKSQLRQDFSDNRAEKSDLIYCGIRGVSSKDLAGPLSGNILEIDIRATEELKCKSISDGCLPIYIFWILIGCVALLFFILVIGIIVLCINRRPASANKTPKPGHNKKMVGKFPDKDSPLYNVYVNQAYIQDSDGQLKLVAADGELLPYNDPKANERIEDQGYATQNSVPHTPVSTPHGFPPAVRRRSISANAVPERENFSSFKQTDDNSKKHVSWNNSNDNMNALDTNRSINYDDDYPVHTRNGTISNSNSNSNLSKGISKSQEIITVTPIAKDRYPKPSVNYANPKSQSRSEATTMTPVPSISSAIDTTNRNNFLNSNMEEESDLSPIYASVSRSGHRPVSNSTNNYNGVPVYNRFGVGKNNNYILPTANPVLPKKPQNIGGYDGNPTREMGEHPLGAGRFSRELSNRKSARLDAFPSSESETYSDISRGIPVPKAPPLPPPLFSASDLNKSKAPNNSGRNTYAYRTNGDGSERNSSRMVAQQQQPKSPQYQSNPPPPLSRSPPSDNSFAGIRSHLEQHMSKTQFNRPPPPPRQDKFPLSSVSNASSYGSKHVHTGDLNPPEQDYDEGSDFWDDGDDFDDFKPGQSYA